MKARNLGGIGPRLLVGAALALLLGLLAFVSPALAGPPVHLPLPDLNLESGQAPVEATPGGELNHACGTAVDSEGDLYVASAGKGYVDIFRPTEDVEEPWEYLSSIEDVNEPCGLAVDSKGNLYVSEVKTGNVVKYTPNAYPFLGAPSYGAPIAVDSSGEAKGIAVDVSDDRLYVARGSEVAAYQSDGTTGQNEVQDVLVYKATGGTYTLSFNGETTAAIDWDAPHNKPSTPEIDSVQEALEALPAISAGSVSVVEGRRGTKDHRVIFEHALGSTNVSQLSADTSLLTGSVFVNTRIEGFEFDGIIGNGGELTEATGVAAHTFGSGDRYVSVADDAGDEIKIFTGRGIKNLALQQTIDGSKTPAGGIGFGPAGAQLTADWSSGHLFIYDDAHAVVDEFEASGHYLTQIDHPDFADAAPTGIASLPNQSEIQTITLFANGGEFTLSFNGDSTSALPYEALAPEVEAALEGLTGIGPEGVAVSGGGTSAGSHVPLRIRFTGPLGNQDVTQLSADAEGLSGVGLAEVGTELQGFGPGRLYATTGAGADAKVLAFAPLTPPSRPPRERDSFAKKKIRSVAVDRFGTRYVAVDSTVYAYGPTGTARILIKGPKGEDGLANEGLVRSLAVDSQCNVYALDRSDGFNGERFVYFAPDSCPPNAGTKYKAPVTVAMRKSFPTSEAPLSAVAVNPANDHAFVTNIAETMELDAAKKSSSVLDPDFAAGLGIAGNRENIAVYGATGNLYIGTGSGTGKVWVIDPMDPEIINDEQLVAAITGVGSPRGPFGSIAGAIAVDQSNGHVLVFDSQHGTAQEFEPSGAFVAEFGSYTDSVGGPGGIAIDNSCTLHSPPLTEASTPTCKEFDPSDGNAYVAFDDPNDTEHPFDLTAFGPLAYGEPPIAITGIASGVGVGSATLNGTVDPRGSELTDCTFEYLLDTEYKENKRKEEEGEAVEPFTGATSTPCAETLEEIGIVTEPVPVHADIGSLDPEARYRFRLVSKNKFGASAGDPALFGPPLLTTRPAFPIAYTEATLRATIDPSGLSTHYHFEYVDDAVYQKDIEELGPGHGFDHAKTTPPAELPADAGPTDVEVPVFGLAEGTLHHFRILVDNEGKAIIGPDQAFETRERLRFPPCLNDEYRTGFSAALPDCRAYELVTPADTRGKTPYATGSGTAGRGFNNWLITPRGERAGESLAYFVDGTLPGFDGSGRLDGYRAVRTKSEGSHPKEGWKSQLFSPSYRELGGGGLSQQGVASDQEYSFWRFGTLAGLEEALESGHYLRLRTPTGFHPLGQGSLGTDLEAESKFVSAGGTHVIFSSKERLEPNAPPMGTEAVYDRAAGQATSHVVSLLPGDLVPTAGEDATYVGSTEDGSAVAFRAGGALYLRRDNAKTVKVADAPNAFAGISSDGKRVFYADATFTEAGADPAGLFVCDVEVGPCTGAEPLGLTQIAANSIFVNVPTADPAITGVGKGGTQKVYFTSEDALTGGEENEAGEAAETNEHNLYVWDGTGIGFIAVLDPQDFVSFEKDPLTNFRSWTKVIGAGVGVGRNRSPARSTANGEVLVFQSHAQLTPYANQGFAEIYRYDPAVAGRQLTCVSCDPSGASPSADVTLQFLGVFAPIHETTLIPNVTDDGQTVFFESEDPLLPDDANHVADVYEWKAPGEGCKRAGGCLALISSGQGDTPSHLYGMTPDGHDVFFRTLEKLVSADTTSSSSIYDARVEGGIPDPPVEVICQGDACQGQGSLPPALPSPASTGSGDGNVERRPSRPCPRGRRKVRRHGRTRCVAKHHKRRHHQRRAKNNRGPQR